MREVLIKLFSKEDRGGKFNKKIFTLMLNFKLISK